MILSLIVHACVTLIFFRSQYCSLFHYFPFLPKAVDIIIGGPPCVDYSRVNAYRKGSQGLQGQYMLQLGSFCRSLERIQHPHPLLFCGENVWLEDKDRESVSRAFGLDWDPIALDALYLSPTRRNRHFLTNIPQSDIDYGSDLSHLSPKDCLEEGFYVPAQLLDKDVTAKVRGLGHRMLSSFSFRTYSPTTVFSC